jgi:hypothetical protein
LPRKERQSESPRANEFANATFVEPLNSELKDNVSSRPSFYIDPDCVRRVNLQRDLALFQILGVDTSKPSDSSQLQRSSPSAGPHC